MHIIKFTQEQIAPMRCMDDFYALTGALDYIKDATNGITSVQQIFMNKEECDALINLILGNITGKSTNNSKGKKHANDAYQHHIRNSIALDWANLSPVSNEKTPRGELWMCSQKEADKILKKMRASTKKKNKKENRDV